MRNLLVIVPRKILSDRGKLCTKKQMYLKDRILTNLSKFIKPRSQLTRHPSPWLWKFLAYLPSLLSAMPMPLVILALPHGGHLGTVGSKFRFLTLAENRQILHVTAVEEER
jgi:hypothetical protein